MRSLRAEVRCARVRADVALAAALERLEAVSYTTGEPQIAYAGSRRCHASHMGDEITQADQSREVQLRRMAHRQGLALEKSRKRNPRARGYGTYQLVDRETGTIVALGPSSGFGLTADEIEGILTEGAQRPLTR
jgi:hypothetical protein